MPLSKYKRPALITLGLAAIVGGVFTFWPDSPEPPTPEAKIEMLEGRVRYERERAERFEAMAKSAQVEAAKLRSENDSLEKHRITVIRPKYEIIRNSPNVGIDSLKRFFAAWKDPFAK